MYACALRAAQLHPGNAQISRHPPHCGRDDRPNRSDALAALGGAPSAQVRRQAGTLHGLRGSCLPAGPHWTLRPAASVYWHERFWRHY